MPVVRHNISSCTLKTLALASVVVFMQSCSGSQIGQELANSFDGITDVSELKTTTLNSSKAPLKKEIEAPKKKSIRPTDRNEKVKRKRNTPIKLPPFTPQPYRITIKLSAANPSAPAETVTKALRAAGIRFSVERIEQVQQQSLEKDFKRDRQRR